MAAKKTEGAKKAGALSKSALINAVVEETGDVTRKQVKTVLEALADIAHKELKKAGIFTVPGFAKFRVVKKPATKARQGTNPFTKQPQTFAAKPASKSVRARPIKAIKDALG
jgi:nucleoid DNA-binding protein